MSKTFEVNLPSFNGDEWMEFEAYDVEDAAKQFAEYYDQDDHPLINNSEFVRVRELGTEEITICVISAEASIDYWASECTERKCRECKKDMMPEILETGKCGYDRDDAFCNRECYAKYYRLNDDKPTAS